MKKTVKMISVLMISAIMLFSLVGCTPTKGAEKTVDAYFTALKEGRTDELSKYMDKIEKEESTAASTEPHSKKDDNADEMFTSLASRIEYEIISSEKVDDSTVKVRAKITNVDMIPIFKEYMELSFGLVFTQDNAEAQKKLDDYLVECIKNPNAKTVTKEIDIEVKKKDGSWKINPSKELLNAVFGNMFTLSF